LPFNGKVDAYNPHVTDHADSSVEHSLQLTSGGDQIWWRE